MHIPVGGLDRILIPKRYTIKQKYDNAEIDDVAATICTQIEKMIIDKESYAGKSIGITVDSRGIPG